MIDVKRFFTPTIRYKVGDQLNEQQAAAASRVNQIMDKVDLVGAEMQGIDESPRDYAPGRGRIDGGVKVPGRFGLAETSHGYCEIDGDNRVKELSVSQRFDKLRATIDRAEKKAEVHFQDNTNEDFAVPFFSWQTTEFDEYITLDGKNVSYQKVER